MTVGVLLIENQPSSRSSGFDEALRSVGYVVRRTPSDGALLHALADFPCDAIILEDPAPGETVKHVLDLLACFPAADDAALGLIARSFGPHDGRFDFVLEETGTADYLHLLPILVHSLQKRNPLVQKTTVSWCGLTLSTRSREITTGHRTLRLTRQAFAFLNYIARRPGRVFTRRQLVSVLWPHGEHVDERSVDVLVMRLRKALAGTDAARLITTVHNQGYMFRPRSPHAALTAVPSGAPGMAEADVAMSSTRASPFSINVPRSVPQ